MRREIVTMKPGHENHLCKLVVGDQVSFEELKPLVRDPNFICSACGRTANKAENLCAPEPL